MITETFTEVLYHRLSYFLTPQKDVYQNIAVEIIEPMAKKRPLLILDYGCGNGVGTTILARKNCKLYGVDCDPHVIAFSQDVFGHLVNFSIANWQEQVNIPNLFDVITCIEVIEHLEYPVEFLENLHHRLAPGGVLVMTTPNHHSQFRKNRAHIGRFEVRGFRTLLSQVFQEENVRIVDYTLKMELPDDITISPMVAVCHTTGKQNDVHGPNKTN